MAASKKNAKGSKTAHVLNLLTAPGVPKEGAPAGEETAAEAAVEPAAPAAPSRPLLPPILEVAQANDDNLAQQIQRALEEELDETPAPAAEQPTQSVIEEVSPVATELPTTEQTPAAPAASGGKMSQEEIEKLLAAAGAPAAEPAPAPAPAPTPAPAASGGKMSQEEIEKLLCAAAARAAAASPAPAHAASGGKMSQEEIEKLLSAAAAPAAEPAPAPAPAASGGKMSQEEIEKLLSAAAAPTETPAPAPAPAPAPQAAPAAEKPAPKPQAPKEEEISYTNIMQVLVEEKAPRYIKKFGICTCKQCEADVKALTLTNLVPKYVVLSKLDRIPMLTVYEGRFNSTVVAQLTRSCKIVMDSPRHDR